MDNLNLNKHISGQFNAELEHIRTQVLTMGGLVEQQLTDAITAMHNQDGELAKRVIEGDAKVNMMEVAIDEACVRIIAKRQPTASDLRLVMAIIKTISELERIGDVADKICRTALEKFSHQHQPLLVSLESLGRHTVQMLHDVLDAFARMDLDEAIRIYREDKKSRPGIRRHRASADDLHDGRFAHHSERADRAVLRPFYRAYRRPLPEHLRIYLLFRQRAGFPSFGWRCPGKAALPRR